MNSATPCALFTSPLYFVSYTGIPSQESLGVVRLINELTVQLAGLTYKEIKCANIQNINV